MCVCARAWVCVSHMPRVHMKTVFLYHDLVRTNGKGQGWPFGMAPNVLNCYKINFVTKSLHTFDYVSKLR